MLTMNGYPIIFNPSSKHANKDGYMYEHTYIAEQILGRELKDEEVVHHKDKNRCNNQKDNLIIFATKKDHSQFHKRNCDESLLQKRKDNTYEINLPENDYILNKRICPLCGNVKDKDANMCVQCHKLNVRNNSNINKTNRENLKELIRNLPFTQIAKIFNVADNTIRSWCEIFNLPKQKYLINSFSDEEWMNL